MEKPKGLEHLSDEHIENRKQYRMSTYSYLEGVRNMIDNDLKNFIFEEGEPLSKEERLKYIYDKYNDELIKIEKYIDPELGKEDLVEIEFLRHYIKELLKTFYDNRKFSEIFQNQEAKEKFLELMKKYLYTDEKNFNYMTTDFVWGKLAEKYPKHNGLLTVEEIDRLLDGGK